MISNPNPRQYKFPLLVALACTAVLAMTLALTPNTSTSSLSNENDAAYDAIEPVVADFWQKSPTSLLDKDSNHANPSTSTSIGTDGQIGLPALDYATIEEQLLKIKVDENGDVILDRDANNRIASGFQNVPLPLSPELIADLQQTISKSLPSPLGSQVAEIISGYHDYLVAVKNESDLLGPPQSIEEQKQRLQQRIELQTLILGESNAYKLFAQENADQLYMLEGMQVATNQELSPEQRNFMLTELERQRQQMKPAINNWDSRYEQFERNREAIEDAALSSGDKTQQIRSLYRQSFDMAERAQIEEMGAVSLN